MNLIAELLQRLFWPPVDGARAAAQACVNGGFAGLLMLGNHALFGAYLLFAGAPPSPGLFQLSLAFVYILLVTAAWTGSRAASLAILLGVAVELFFELTVTGDLRWVGALHLAALILAAGGVRGAFALARLRRSAG